MIWLHEWRARPWGDREVLQQLAQLNAMTFNHFRDPKAPPRTMADFMPDERPPEAPPADEDVLSELMRYSV